MVIGKREQSHFTAVPDEFIDRYMPGANGEFVKVYLYLLRFAAEEEREISVSGMADVLACTEADVLRALRYWERRGLLLLTVKDGAVERIGFREPGAEQRGGSADSSAFPESVPGSSGGSAEEQESVRAADRRPVSLSVGDFLTDGSISGGRDEEEEEHPAQSFTGGMPSGTEISGGRQPREEAGTGFPGEVTASAQRSPRRIRRDLTADRIASVQSHGDFRQFAYVAETYFRRPLTSKETQLFAYLYDSLGFSEDLLEYLLEYCIDTGHRNARYIESVAFGWYDEGITTVDQAKEMHQSYKRENREVMKAFGISGRVLTDEERRKLGYWLKDLGMPLPVIVEACNQTMGSIHSPSFAYANSILESWKKAGITTVDQAKAYVQQRREARKAAGAKKPEDNTDRKKSAQRTKNRFQNYRGREVDYDALLAGSAMEDYSKG